MIKNVVFDINGVLTNIISLETVAAFDYSLKEGAVFIKLASSEIWQKYDLGFYKTRESMIDDFCRIYPEDSEVIAIVLRKPFRYTVNDKMVKFLVALKKKYNVYLLSNVGQQDLDRIRDRKFMTVSDGGVFSCEEGCVKPDKKIYERLIEKYGIIPEETVFIDDGAANVAAARKMGFHAVRYITERRTESEVCRIIALE